jgi:hypothetical protein
MNTQPYLDKLREQARRVYVQIKSGYPVSDKDKYRLEGLITAGITLGVITNEEAQKMLEDAHHQVLGSSIAERKAREKTDWNEPKDYSDYDSPSFTRNR